MFRRRNVFAPSLYLDFARAPDSAIGKLTFTRASSGTYLDSTGTIQTALTNVARIGYTEAGAFGGLFIEEARTNLLLNSATLSTQNVTVTNVAHTLSFYGTGTLTLTGTSTDGPLVGTGVGERVTLTFTPTAGTLTVTVTGTVSNAQLEIGSFATSWISTAGATATRAADVCSIATSAFPFNASEGTFALDLDALHINSGNSYAVCANDGSANNAHFVGRSTASGLFITNVGGAAQASMTTGTIVAGTPFNLAYAYQASNFAAVKDAGTVATDSSGTVPAGITTLQIGARDSVIEPWNGHIRRIAYYPTRLSNTQLQALTAA